MAVGYIGFIYVTILLVGRSIWRPYHVCRFLVGDAKTFYCRGASPWDSLVILITYKFIEPTHDGR